MKIAFVLALSACTVIPGAGWMPAAPTERTVYITATDDKKEPVPDLAAADLVVKEGGKEREVVKAERATSPIRLALAVEEQLTADGSVRTGLFEFMKRMSASAEIALITIGLRNTTVTDYTSSIEALVGGINKFSLNPARESAVAEGVLELSNRFSQAKPPRPVMVVLAVSGGQASVDQKLVLEKLGQSGATMFAVTLAGGGDAGGQVLGDGPKQSGGRRIDVTATAAMPRALLQIANDLAAQYAITYTVPDGVKLDKRFSVSTKRRGVSLRAPSTIPDK